MPLRQNGRTTFIERASQPHNRPRTGDRSIEQGDGPGKLRGRLTIWVVALALALPPTAWAGQDGRTPPPARTLAEIVALLREMHRPGMPQEDPHRLTEHTEPPLAPLRTQAAWSQLTQATTSMTEYINRVSPGVPVRPFDRLSRESLRLSRTALTELMQVEPDFTGALEHLRQSVELMFQAWQTSGRGSEDSRFAEEAQETLARIGARLAADGLLRARTAGLTGNRLSQAEAAFRAGLDQVNAGQYVLAFDQFKPPIFVGNLPYFSLDLYEQNVRSAFEGQVVGYQYAIAQKGQLVRTGADGVARTSADPPATPQSATKEMNIASTSKTITASVLIQILEDKGVSVDGSISPWLPASWTRGPGIDELTFRDLLTHRSGLNDNQGGGYELADLESYIAAGVEGVDVDMVKFKDKYQYQNGNFALFRVAIPHLQYGEIGVQLVATLFFFIPFDEIIAGMYMDAIHTYAFNQTGFITADCQPNDATQTFLYTFPDDGFPGFQNGDWTVKCGSGGWYMSSVELVGFLAYRRYTQQIMTQSARGQMDAGFLGWMDPANYDWGNGLYGIYRNHGGDLFYDSHPGGLDACIIDYPNGIQTAVLINSIGGNYEYQCRELADAYDNAFIVP